jgi:geranylgeranyl pyrophosphate synthase
MNHLPKNNEDWIKSQLNEVQRVMAARFETSSLKTLLAESKGLLAQGKMLRSRLAFRVGPSAGAAHKTLVHAAAGVEMIHTASLLHDDVIDGGFLRRGAPAFWVERGVSGAILLGDMMLFGAMDIVCQVEDSRLAHPFVRFIGEVCEAESEQELVYRGQNAQWEDCVRIARHKTGALFAFVAYASAGSDAELRAALTEAGYLAGTAYQLADDILDAKGNPNASDKTLGTDEARRKNTAMGFLDDMDADPAEEIGKLCATSSALLKDWPPVQGAWDAYLDKDLNPSLQKVLQLLHS